MVAARDHAWVALHHYRRRWAESRGDAWDSWGPAVYLFEVDDNGLPVRQVERYDAGPTLRYGPDHPEDEHGGLSTVRLDPDEWLPFSVSPATFEEAWAG